MLLAAAAACSPGPPAEHTGMSTTGSCGCCGTIVDIAQGQSCDEPGLCVAYCGEDGGGDGPHDAGTSQ